MSIALPLCFVGALALGGVAVRRAGSRGFGHAGHWGHAGAGILLTTGRRVLVLLRSEDVTEPGTWNLAGGAVDSDEEPLVAGLREMEEETGLLLPYRTTKALGFTVWNSPDRSFRYTTSVVRVPEAFTKKRIELNWENDEHKWVDVAWLRANEAELHPGFRAKLTELITLAFDPGEVVDVPSRPPRPAGEPAAPDSAAFRRWFNASAVAWADGTPRQVVHNAPAEMIETSDLFREPPNGIDAAVYWVARYVRNATPGWLVLAPNVASETAARTLGTRVIRTLRAPRGLRADQIRLHGLALTVGWTGGIVRVGEG